MKIREVSTVFDVPPGTRQDRLHLRVAEMPRIMGPDSIPTKEEETVLKDWFIALTKCGCPLKCDDLSNLTHLLVIDRTKNGTTYF